ncbi:MAG: OmpW family outer membrane protein [Steroidobacteraceae bacterium]
MNTLSKRVGLLVAGLVTAAAAQAGQGDWVTRVRATYLHFDNGQNSLPVKVEADSRVIPEIDFSYYLTDNVSTELVLTYPQKVDIAVNNTGAGSVKALPPTLLAQYHFGAADAAFSPYVGAGLNLTLFSSRSVLNGGAHISKSSVGVAGQIGADMALSGAWSLNVDLKYITMNTNVYVGSTKAGKLDLNPWVASVGIGYKF